MAGELRHVEHTAMSMHRPEQIISVIGTQFYQPIADLVSKLVTRSYQPVDRVGSNYYEGGYSAAIILLLAASVESLVQRDRYFYRALNPVSRPSDAASQYSKTILHYRRHGHLEEVFEVRNSIAHNHLWEIEFTTPPEGGRQHKRSQVVAGTHRLRVVPPPETRIPRTRRLRVNLQPGRLDRTDVAKVLATCLHFLAHLSNRGHRPIALTMETVAFKGKRLPFPSLLSEVESALQPGNQPDLCDQAARRQSTR